MVTRTCLCYVHTYNALLVIPSDTITVTESSSHRQHHDSRIKMNRDSKQRVTKPIVIKTITKHYIQISKTLSSDLFQAIFSTLSDSATDLYPVCRTLHKIIKTPNFLYQRYKVQSRSYQSPTLGVLYPAIKPPISLRSSKSRVSYRSFPQTPQAI
jgi:hypothetical protein